MELEVLRFSSQDESTLGLLFDVTAGRGFLCYTLEDEFRPVKVAGDTRIPAGRYRITLRTVGGHDTRYRAKFPGTHKGMLWIRDVPGFQYILIHIGNRDDDTDGCLLVGDGSLQNLTEDGSVPSSRVAYLRIYPPIAAAIERGEETWITYKDYDAAGGAGT